MNWPRLALTKDQQAPLGLAAQPSRVSPSQVALKIAHCSAGQITEAAMMAPTMVRMVSPTLPKRLARIHGQTPCTRIGGGEAFRISCRTKETSPCDCMSVTAPSYRSVSAMRALNQFMASEITTD